MLPAPILALIRYAVVYACAKATAAGWSFFGFDPATTDAIVQVIALVIAASMAGIGAWAATVKSVVERLRAKHRAELLDGAASVPGVAKIVASPALAEATASPKVVSGATS